MFSRCVPETREGEDPKWNESPGMCAAAAAAGKMLNDSLRLCTSYRDNNGKPFYQELYGRAGGRFENALPPLVCCNRCTGLPLSIFYRVPSAWPLDMIRINPSNPARTHATTMYYFVDCNVSCAVDIHFGVRVNVKYHLVFSIVPLRITHVRRMKRIRTFGRRSMWRV